MPELPAERRPRLEIEPTGATAGHCDCCGSTTERVWGFVHGNKETLAAYFVSWARQRPNHGASFDFILGKWGESATPQERYVVSLDCRIIEGAPQFMVVDAHGRLPSAQDVAESALTRSEVIGTPLAPQIFQLVDEVYISDPRLAEIRNWHR